MSNFIFKILSAGPFFILAFYAILTMPGIFTPIKTQEEYEKTNGRFHLDIEKIIYPNKIIRVTEEKTKLKEATDSLK